MKKNEVIKLINELKMKEVKFFSRHWNPKQILFKSKNGINYIVCDFETNEWAQR